MRMYASRLTNPANPDQDTTCEECGWTTATFGVVPLRDLENIQSNGTMTRREKVEYLIWEQGIGEIICTECLKKRIKK